MSPPPELVKADGLWFPIDGIILRAEETIFRVPKSILGARSSVFQVMFEFPQPATGGDGEIEDETIDGIPVVRLHDSAKDVEVFLRAIFDSGYFMPPPSPVEVRDLLGILRLSHKYDVKYLFKRAIAHFETRYPLHLDKVGEVGTIRIAGNDGRVLKYRLKEIPTFHRVGATWLLPCAYYGIGTYSVERLVEFGPTWFTLPEDMKQTCFLLPKLQTAGTARLFDALTLLSTCESPHSCNLTKFEWLKNTRPDPEDPLNQDPLFELTFNRGELEAALCETCVIEARAHYNAAQANIWNQLPANCGLEGWDALLEQRRVALELE
ncbi:hypothetical protein B0H16DRAFT_1367197 [Mycena metata]|uniref:BTB domain-containing protein n=1 Tax=Mycena metata TaxID=1033252 RepID=A0AAD7NMA4_9AGAR|nr:hypothetical protein B0H16DRAFT_1367197 [Mycena metata]